MVLGILDTYTLWPRLYQEVGVFGGAYLSIRKFKYREAVLDDGEWVLRCPERGHVDRLLWLSEEARPLVLAVARRRTGLQLRREVRS